MAARSVLLPALALLLLVLTLAALALGEDGFRPLPYLHALLDRGDATDQLILYELRLPRILNAIAVGAMLGLAGALLQSLTHNPLADPYVLGVSGGASVAVLIGLLLGLGSGWSPLLAWIGAGASLALLLGLSGRNPDNRALRLLLGGVMLAAGWGALSSLLLALANNQQLPGMVFWLLGDLGNSGPPELSLGLLGAGLALALLLSNELDLWRQGRLRSRALGGQTNLPLWIFLLCALLSAGAVAQAGPLGFVGLVAAHLARALGARGHRIQLPAATLTGALLLLGADTMARTLIAPRELPAGVFTALLGVLVFFLLFSGRTARRGRHA